MAKLYKLLGQSSFWIVNKHLARYFGDNDMALFVSDMVDKQGYHTSNNQLVEGKWWYSTAESTYEDTNIPVKRRQRYIQELQKREILEVKKMGLPCKTYFNVNMENLEKLLETMIEDEPNKFSQNDQTVMVKTTKQESSKRPNILYNNNKVIRIKNNNKLIKEKINYFEKFKDDKELIEWCNLYSEAINKRCIKSIELHEELKKMTDWVDSKKKAHSNPLRFAKNWLQKKLDNLPVSISLSTSQPTYSPNLQEIDPDYEPPQTYRRGGMQSISNLLNF